MTLHPTIVDRLRTLAAMYHDHPGIREVEFIVEADAFSHHALWAARTPAVIWRSVTLGVTFAIDHLEIEGQSWPINFMAEFAEINGRRVAFYHSESQIVDHRRVYTFAKLLFLNHRQVDLGQQDAKRFAHTLAAINALNAAAVSTKGADVNEGRSAWTAEATGGCVPEIENMSDGDLATAMADLRPPRGCSGCYPHPEHTGICVFCTCDRP